MIDNETDANISLFAKEMLERMKYPNKSLLDTDTGKKLQLKDLMDPQGWYGEWKSRHDIDWNCVPKWDVVVEDCKKVARQSEHPRKNSFWAACFFLSEIYKKGIGVEKNEVEAGEWGKMFKELEEIEDRIKQNYGKGKGVKSLFLSALELTFNGNQPGILDKIRDSPFYDKFPYAHFVRFLYDFWSQSPGNEFWSLWKPYSSARTQQKVDQFDCVWEAIYGTDDKIDANNNEDSRLTKIKSKCWVLAAEERGGHSEVWDCLRDAIHSYQNNDGEIVISDQKNDERAFMTLLRSKPDSVEWREYCSLVEILARQEKTEKEPWRTLAEKCRTVLGSYAYVDWYLHLEGDQGSLGVGFDDFPPDTGDSSWRDFKIDGVPKHIGDDSYFAWFEPVSWDISATVGYKGLSEADSHTPALFTNGRKFEVFIRYRSAKGDRQRRNWWRWDAEPVMKSSENEFLICANDEAALNLLQKRSSPEDQVEWEMIPEGTFRAQRSDGTKQDVHYRKIAILNRPDDKDTCLVLGDNVPAIDVKGKRPVANVSCNDTGIRLDCPSGNLVAFPSTSISLSVKYFRAEKSYKWTIVVRGLGKVNVRKVEGSDCSIELTEAEMVIGAKTALDLDISCEEIGEASPRQIGTQHGIVLPDAIKRALLTGSSLPTDWSQREPETSPIDDYLHEGCRKTVLVAPNGEEIKICIPRSDFCWWFENDNNHYEQETILYSANESNLCLPEFNADELGDKSICILRNDDEPRPEGFSETGKGYWRGVLSDLVSTEEYIFTEIPPLREHPINGVSVFRYRFIPSERRLCKNEAGEIGLFIPESDKTAFSIVAFSDKTRDLLLSGKVIANADSSVSFTNLKNAWTSFQNETIGWDAIISFFPEAETPSLLSLVKRPSSEMYLRRGDDQAYGKEQLYIVSIIKSLCGDVPNNSPIQSMWLFRNQQEMTYQEVKNGWQDQIGEYNVTGIHAEALRSLVRKWADSGFDPFLEGIAVEFWGKVKEAFLNHLPAPPHERVFAQLSSQQWKTFGRRFFDPDTPYSKDEAINALRSLDINRTMCGARPRKSRRRQVDAGKAEQLIIDCTKNAREQGLELKRICYGGFPVSEFDRQLQTNQLPPQKLGEELPEYCYRVINHLCLKNNYTSQREREFDKLICPNHNLTPSVVLKTLVQPSKAAELFCEILQDMSIPTHRSRRGGHSNRPTDREWILCAAAATVLPKLDAIPDQEEQDRQVMDALRVLMKLLSNLRDMRPTEEKRQKFFEVRAKCRALAQLSQLHS